MSTVVHIASLSARLDAEWDRLATSTTADEALSRWRRHTTRLAGFTNFEAIRQAVHDRGQPQRADQILAALVRLASVSGHDDRPAAWLVLQLLKPGAVRMAHQLAALAGDMDTSQALVFGELALGIRQYPWQRRPRQIAANLLLDCRQRITRGRQRHHAELPCGLSPDGHHRETDHDLLDNRLAVRHLLWKARQCAVLSAFEVRLLSGVYLDDIPVDQLATVLGRSRSTLYALRSGAERRLREAFAADQPPVRSADPDPDQVAARYQAGRSVAWLARRYGISPQKVLTMLDQASTPETSVRDTTKTLEVETLATRYLAGEAATTLAHQHGISTDTVIRRLQAAGVPTRTVAEANRLRRQRASLPPSTAQATRQRMDQRTALPPAPHLRMPSGFD